MEATYETDSIGVAGLLLCRGWKIITVRPGDNPYRYVIVFPEEAKADAQTYYTGAQVDARAIQDNILMVLALIREAKKGARRV